MSTPKTTELPEVITTYLAAHQSRDLATALACYTDDAVTVDEGHAHRGKQEIRDWLARAAAEYTYTTELTAAQRIDDDHYVTVHHLEGDFPGRTVDLRFRFTLRDNRIARLIIEP